MELLQQTAEAVQAGLKFEGIYDLQPIISAVKEGRLLSPRHLNALASTLDAAQLLMSQVGVNKVERDRGAEASTSTSALPPRHQGTVCLCPLWRSRSVG